MSQANSKILIIFEMANNHMGHLEHGLHILRAFGERVARFREHFDFAFKLQYRDLDTFIHPAFQQRLDLKFVKRFQETRLSQEHFQALKREMDQQGFIPICTPFDEISVDRIEAHGFQVLKIASCSFGDWPLMERIAASSLPIIASTAGVPQETIDQVVSFFAHRQRPLTLLHCIGEYPTPATHLQLNQIDFLRQRYPNHRIGFSSHEAPDNTHFVQMALAKGATVFEKHVGIPLPEAPLNTYSANPDQIEAWLEAALEALQACGTPGQRYAPNDVERQSLHELQRGLWATRDLQPGDRLTADAFILALPTVPGQLTANELSKYAEFQTSTSIPSGGPILAEQVQRIDHRDQVLQIVKQVRTLLKKARAIVSEQADVEISHHYGLDRFAQTGMVIINVVNRAYCKKLLVMLPKQHHPEQYHKQKEETFHILHGNVHVKLDGVESLAKPGDVITVERNVRHEFWSDEGTVIEEISSTHLKDDSYYTDPAIMQNTQRKTQLTYFFG